MDTQHRLVRRATCRPLVAVVAALGVIAATFGPAASVADASAPPACRIADVTTKLHNRADWSRTVLDTTFRLPKAYRPVGMARVRSAGLSGSGSIRRVAVADLKAMVHASRVAGLRLAVRSAYRSYQTQVWTFAKWVHSGGIGTALDTSARPGHSEHQLGTAIDFIRAGGTPPWLVRDWARTREGAWLSRNAWRYGWVMSYPKGRKAATCYAYEPWHYRYVGRDIARQVHDSGRTLRQILWTLQTEPPAPSPSPSPSDTPNPTPTPTDEPTPSPSPTEDAPAA